MNTPLNDLFPVPPVCADCRVALVSQDAALLCPQCAESFDATGGVFDLLPAATRDATSRQGQLLQLYQSHFSERPDRRGMQTLRRWMMALSNGFLYRWGVRQLERFAQGRTLTLLDAACGDGALHDYLAPRHRYTGLDFATRVLWRAHRYHPNTYVRGDLNRLPFPDHSFDAVISLQSLSHLDAPQQAIAEFARVIKPEGRLILTVPNNYTFKYRVQGTLALHTFRFNEQNIHEMVAQHFEIEQFSARGLWLPFPKVSLHLGWPMPEPLALCFVIVAKPKVPNVAPT